MNCDLYKNHFTDLSTDLGQGKDIRGLLNHCFRTVMKSSSGLT